MINREIDYVMEVAKYGSILKAAEKLYISSSALSKYIQNLEARLNVKLFDRIGKRFALTYAGERYLYWISRQQELIKEMESELTDIANSIQGTITIGTPIGLSALWINNTLKRFNEIYPKVKIHLIEDTSKEITQLAVANKVDFAIVENTKDDDSLIYCNLYEETMTLISSKGNTDLNNAAVRNESHKYPWVSLDDCTEMNFIMPWSDQNISTMMNTVLKNREIEIDPLVTTKSISSIMNCVLAGIGITITTDFAVYLTNLQDEVDIYSIGETPITRKWALVYNRNHYLPEHTKKIIDMTIEDYKTLGTSVDKGKDECLKSYF